MNPYYRRVGSALLGCVALSLAVGRCSPVSQTVAKSALEHARSDASPGPASGQLGPQPLPAALSAPEARSSAILKSALMGDPDAEEGAYAADRTLVELSDEELLALQKNLSVRLTVPSGKLKEGLVLLDLEEEIELDDRELERFQLVLTRDSGEQATLSIAEDVTESLRQKILPNLLQLELSLELQKAIESGPPARTPLPSVR